MSDLIQFVKNYNDNSTERGFQFKFFCDKCGNGYVSRFQPNVAGTASGLLNAAEGIFGNFLGGAGQGARQLGRAVGSKAHDAALERAVQEAKNHFKQCTRCGRWVCPEVCWNTRAGLCEVCAPDEQEELAAQQALTTAQQIATKTRDHDYTRDLDLQTKSGIVECSGCGARVAPTAKFCAECGTPNAVAAGPKHCSDCGAKMEAGKKFCAECGAKV